VPSSWIRRQTLVNAERFTTPELQKFEEQYLSAKDLANKEEYEMFQDLRKQIVEQSIIIQKIAKTIGTLDVLFALTRTANKNHWICPEIKTENTTFEIKDGRHPVVEKISTEKFIANDLMMNAENRMHIITGPNIGGKSTFLRQNAIIIFLAQIGSFVPAKKATMSIFDRIFTRVGASDNLAGGKSTFFVEMTETARILHIATEKSFIILDEIGRGTSTFDGISLAWAIAEFLHDKIKAKTLFATHFHELIDVAETFSAGKNFHVAVAQTEKNILFLHKIQEGGISDSFGIEVAKRAGIPNPIIENAKKILAKLEEENIANTTPTLFSSPRIKEKIIEIYAPSKIEQKIKEINPENISPKEALEILFALKKETQEEK